MIGSRRWLRRAFLSALAGGGLTAAGLAGPLTGGALGVETTTGTSSTNETPPPPDTTTTTEEAPPTSTTLTTTTVTATTPSLTTTTATETSSTPAPETTTPEVSTTPIPTVAAQRTQKPTTGVQSTASQTTTSQTQTTSQPLPSSVPAAGSGNVAPPPQVIAQSGALSALLATSTASAQALQFFRVPLFLLPIYQAAAVQYGVPWEILAAINEVETNYGTDLNVSTAGAVGWMQFMPATWMQYGVDALSAGYADPYNPVDAIFAAARYLRAAGASKNLRDAIFSYNHSQAYVETVILRARLLASYPESVLATLTGLTDGSPPIANAKIVAQPPQPGGSNSSATANATALAPGMVVAPAPAASGKGAVHYPLQFTHLIGSSGGPVVAVEDGRVASLGTSHRLGRYLTLRDVYGDVFTYAGLGNIAPTYKLPKTSSDAVPQAASTGAQSAGDPTPKLPASAGHQPVSPQPSQGESAASAAQSVPVGKVRLFAHPNNPEAIAVTARSARSTSHDGWLALRRGSVLAQGTVIGHLGAGGDAQLRFAIRPAGDQSTIDPRPIIENWKQLNAALHPRGAKGNSGLIGATADDVFLLTKGELERTVLSDPGITLGGCDRQEIASGAARSGLLASLLFLSRSGLKPTVSTLRCGQNKYTSHGSISPYYAGDAVAISAVNGIPILKHQGAGTIADLTIRTLLTLQGQYAPHRIISLMQYPGAHSTLARASHGNYIELEFLPETKKFIPNPKPTKTAAHSAATAKTAPSPLNTPQQLSVPQWNQLITRVGSLQVPAVSTKPSSSAIRDPQAAKTNRDLGTRTLP
ncbi:MAG TPA: lytic murein transglycosylase [Solirubrobacteraceae bacterium]|jgi:hypothetical protein